MEVINDLVKKLNQYGAYGEYYIRKGKAEEYLLCKRYTEGEDATLFEFAKKQPYWSIHPSLGVMHNQVQEDIMDFVYSTDKEHWFDEPEKKYNIIIGEYVITDEDGLWKAAYRKCGYGTYGTEVVDNADENDLTLYEFRFTESEIEDLKATLPENMAKIVELGKVEVKDENVRRFS
ncbi:hypothetical protein AKUG0406_PHAGE200130 (plasmid) [Apilactobacillus kunkeei]|nr:hypothetical protein AKUG0406_PHAGE200130 [Apilactobacillus kunkeei]CAI2676814.1 hypothetical protein AKUG0403_PHAGE200140 [Apilactobacillus kunkeei]CAI2680301.1 hypothetical protein AKUG0420_PHAGE200140 [Apilactobacillus kunkeei]